MGYTLELRVGSVDAVVAELRTPSLTAADVDELRGDDGVLDDVLDRWAEFARAAADGAAAGGGALDPGMAAYVVAVVHRLTHWYGALGHTSSGGDAFRALLAGPATQVLGAELVRALLTRDLAGLTSGEYPFFGWVANAELRTVVERGLTAPAAGPGPDDEEQLRRLVAAVERAANHGLDLFGVYA